MLVPRSCIRGGFWIGSMALIGVLASGCRTTPEPDYSGSMELQGTLRCCVNMGDEDIPEPKSGGWYIQLDSSYRFGGVKVDRLDVLPLYSFQMEDLQRLDGRDVNVIGFVTKAFVIQRNEWSYGIKIISIEAADKVRSPRNGKRN